MTAPADSIATNPMPSEIRTIRRVVSVAVAAVAAIGGGIAGVVTDHPIVTIGVLVAAGLLLAVSLWMINLSFDRWRWGIDDRWIERRSGVVVHRTQVVPRSRVQTVTTRTGPIDRWLELSSIVIHTAGTHTPNLTIPHLEQAVADQLRAELGG